MKKDYFLIDISFLWSLFVISPILCNVIKLHNFNIVIRWIQVIWTPQLKCYWFPFCTFTIKLMKWNVNDDFMGVMSQKGAGHLYILCIWESVSYLFIMLFILYYYCCLLLNWTVLRLLWHTDISPFAGPIKEFWLSQSRSLGIAWGGQWRNILISHKCL